MKKLMLFVSMAVVFATVSCKESRAPQGSEERKAGPAVTWLSFSDGIALAKKEKKPVLIDFYAGWCRWCRVMDETVFTDPDIAGILKDDFVAIRLHTDRPGSETIRFKNHEFSISQFSMALGVKGLPTLVFMDHREDLITRIPGYSKKDLLVPVLNYIRERCYEKNIDINEYVHGNISCGGK